MHGISTTSMMVSIKSMIIERMKGRKLEDMTKIETQKHER